MTYCKHQFEKAWLTAMQREGAKGEGQEACGNYRRGKEASWTWLPSMLPFMYSSDTDNVREGTANLSQAHTD